MYFLFQKKKTKITHVDSSGLMIFEKAHKNINYLPNHFLSESFINIWETYKLAPEISEAILLNFGNVTDSELQLTSEEIWQRRQNMRGHFFRATSLPNKPYVTEVSNGCKSQECFKGTVLPTLTIFTHSDL